MATPETKFLFVKNGRVTAVTFPGETGSITYGELKAEVPFDTEIGVGDEWPRPEAVVPKATKVKTAKAPAVPEAAADAAAV